MNAKEVLTELKKYSVPANKEGMARFGINTEKALGVSVPNMRKLAKKIGKNHELALGLWQTDIHEAMILASMVDEAEKVSAKQMDLWIKEFNSWDLCDQCCMNLFDKTSAAWSKAIDWTKREKEFEKRAGFALMACLAWHDKETKDKEFEKFFPFIKKESADKRNFVKKAVNWALRQIGKRNKALNKKAIKVAKEILKKDDKASQWIAKDAIKELESKAVRKRLKD